ncbi:MAG: TSUP family transporter [Exilibacterium sp.]
MAELIWYQYGLIALIFVWSGFVRSGLGFGGSVLSLPFLLLVDNRPLVYLPIIAVHLLVFATATIWFNNAKPHGNRISTESDSKNSTVAWAYLKYSLGIMIVPKLIGVLGLITLPATLMSGIIFFIISIYSVSYIFNRPFRSNSKLLDIVFLMLGGYVSGTSLIGAPLVIAVYATHVPKEKLRDTLFALWVILVAIKVAAFIIAGVDLQLIHHLWLLPCAGVGHVLGLRFHTYMMQRETSKFFRLLGSVLLVVSLIGLGKLAL